MTCSSTNNGKLELVAAKQSERHAYDDTYVQMRT
jgi:hypothetical protein